MSGGFCLSLAVLTFGVQGLSGTGAAVVLSQAPASGAVGPGTLDPAMTGIASAGGSGPAATSAFTADPLALVAFARSTIRTTSKDGVSGELNVASAGLKRPAEGFLMAPLESIHETSPFGLRTSPISGSAGEFHWGQDYAAECGTRVYAADAGVVRAVGWHPWGGGNRVEIDHGNGLITTYNHLEAIAVKKGDSVRVGEVIARVGTTGSSTGCHLHFETILNGSHKNPHDWILLPIVQTDKLGAIEMTSYAPEAGLPSNASLGWAIPVSDDGRHEVAGGTQEKPVAAMPRAPYLTSASSTAPSTRDTSNATPTTTDPRTPSGTPRPSEPGTTSPPSPPPASTTPPVVEPAPLPVVVTPPPPVVEPAPLPVVVTPPPPVVEPAPLPVVVTPPPPVVAPAPPPPGPTMAPALPAPTVAPALPAPSVAPVLPAPTVAPVLPAPTDPSLTPRP